MSVLSRLKDKASGDWISDSREVVKGWDEDFEKKHLGAISLDKESGSDNDNASYLKNLGFNDDDINRATSNYTPKQGGFFQKLYESTAAKPREIDEETEEKQRRNAAIVDSFSLLSQLAAAAGGGDVRERKAVESSTGVLYKQQKELRDLYRKQNRAYRQGLIKAMQGDYTAGYNNWENNKKAIQKALSDRADGERKISELNKRHEQSLALIDRRGELSAAEKEKERAFRQKQYDKSNSLAQQRINLSRQRGRGEGVGSGGSKISNKTKTLIFPSVQGVPGSVRDEITGETYMPLTMTIEEYMKTADIARNALLQAQQNGDVGALNDVNVSKLNDEEAIRIYVDKVNPELLYDIPKKAYDIVKTGRGAYFPSLEKPLDDDEAFEDLPDISGDSVITKAPEGMPQAEWENHVRFVNSLVQEELFEAAEHDGEFRRLTGIRKKPSETQEAWKERMSTAYKEYMLSPSSYEEPNLDKWSKYEI